MSTLFEIYKCPLYNVLYVPLVNVKKKLVGWAIASIEDYDLLSKCSFHLRITRNKIYAGSGNITMHELIHGKAPEGFVIDHLNSDGLDNRRGNLRFATPSQNSQNRVKEMGKYSSDYTGVSFCPDQQNYRATIAYNREFIHIKRYEMELEAAKAYDVYAIHYYGVHAKTNGLLTVEEIEDIVDNGIPDEYQKKVRELPKNIYHRGNIYSYEIMRDSIRYRQNFSTMEDAVKGRDELLARLDAEKEAKIIVNLAEITRNKDGVAIIYLRNDQQEIVGECLVDDEVWPELARCKWHLRDDDYSSGYIEKKEQMMHLYLYKKYKGETPKGYTVDHSNRIKLDCRLENLRPGNKSLQSHNRDKVKGSICEYKGVTINGNRFVVNTYGQRFSFEFAEDAARKFNEIVIQKHGENAYLNKDIPNTQTRVQDLLPEIMTEEYLKSIKFVELFKQVVKKMKWGGNDGHFNTKKIKITTLDQDIEKAVELLRNGC